MRRRAPAQLPFEAANALLTRVPRACKLKTWGLALAARIGKHRATVAVACKLAVILHRVWKDDRDFAWDETPAAWMSHRR